MKAKQHTTAKDADAGSFVRTRLLPAAIIALVVVQVVFVQRLQKTNSFFQQSKNNIEQKMTSSLEDILTGKRNYDVCIAGAGLSGAVLAERYATQLGAKVLVVEKRDHIGGNCYDYIDKETGVRVSRYGAHLFHTQYEDVWDYVQRFGPWHRYEHKVRGMVNGHNVPIPVNIETVNTLFDLNIQSREEMAAWLKQEQIPSENPQNSEEVALARVGRRLYDLIFKPYTYKQWNKYPAELGPEVLQRIPVRDNWDERYFSDPHQALPTNGYTSLFEEMLQSQHITVLTQTDYFQIRDVVKCGKHYFSGPIDAYFAHTKLPKLEYRSLDFERVVARDTKFFQSAFVVNHPQEADGDFTRIVEYKHLYDQSDLPHTVYFVERSKDDGEPYYPVPNDENKALYRKYQELAQVEERTKNVTFVGRLANYKYFNMDQAIKNALDLFEKDTGIPYQKRKTSSSVDSAGAGSVAVSQRHRSKYPDWRAAVDCSAYDNMCGSTEQINSRYKPYPFPYGMKAHKAHYEYEDMSEVPAEWMNSLQSVNNSLYGPPPRAVEYIYPAEVSSADREACMTTASKLTWKEQIDKLLSSGRIKLESDTNMVAFTISDYNYAFDMIHDVFEMNDNIVGFKDSFFMVTLDDETLEMGCRYGYPVVSWNGGSVKKPENATAIGQGLKQAVANTKFEVSLELIKRGVDFFFYEMDVWFLKSPKDVIREYHSDPNHDLLVSSHQNCAVCMNIGVYSISANERTKEYFDLCVQLAKESPDTHDQWIMGQVVHLANAVRAGRKFTFGGGWSPPPEVNPPPMKYPLFQGFYNAHEIVANERPIPTQHTFAIHTLCGTPLRKPHGKKILAKELGAWYGFEGLNGDGGYYRRTGERRRYLWMDGHMASTYNINMSFDYEALAHVYKDSVVLGYTIAALLALARRTGRIFVMPKVLSGHGAHYLWSILDFESVDEMGIDYRETNFPHNSKSWNTPEEPYHRVARTALGDLRNHRSMFMQLPRATKPEHGNHGHEDDVTSDGEIRAIRFDTAIDDSAALDAWWSMHTAVPEIDEAELLLANPHFITTDFAKSLKARQDNDNELSSVAEREIGDVFVRLRWCFDKTIVPFENVVGRATTDHDCHGKGKPFYLVGR